MTRVPLGRVVVTDDWRMPFGKHLNVQMRDVPASYLLWLGDEIEPSDPVRRALLVYIAENRAALEMEVDEGEGG